MTQPPNSGAPLPVAGVTGGPGLNQGAASIDSGSGNIVLTPPGNAVEIKKAPSAFNVYEFFNTNADNVRLTMQTASGGPEFIGIVAAPTSVTRDLQIGASGNGFIRFMGTIGFNQDSTFDIGAAGGTGIGRPRNVFVGGSVAASALFGGLNVNQPISGSMGIEFQNDNTIDIGSPAANRPRNIYAAGIIYCLGTFQFGNAFTTVATAGAATALPATPALYFSVIDQAGNPRKIPAYNP